MTQFAEARGIGTGLAELVMAELWLLDPSRPGNRLAEISDEQRAVLTLHPKASCKAVFMYGRVFFEIWIDGEMAARSTAEANAWAKATTWDDDAWMRDKTPAPVPAEPITLVHALTEAANRTGATSASIKSMIAEILKDRGPLHLKQLDIVLWGRRTNTTVTLRLLREMKREGVITGTKIRRRVKWSLKNVPA